MYLFRHNLKKYVIGPWLTPPPSLFYYLSIIKYVLEWLTPYWQQQRDAGKIHTSLLRNRCVPIKINNININLSAVNYSYSILYEWSVIYDIIRCAGDLSFSGYAILYSDITLENSRVKAET